MILSVDSLCVHIGGREILHNLSLTFPEGRRTAVIGPNGAGKSTLLRSAAGLCTEYDGRIALNGQDIRCMDRQQLARLLAILPQGAAAPADTTVRELVDYGRFPYRHWFRRADGKADREAVEWALSVTRLESLQNRQVQTLSGGERQRAFLAMALAQKPKILLLDEPTTYLDIAHQLEVMQIVTDINKNYHMTIIMVLHDINHALQYSDEVAVLKEKRIWAQGRPGEVLTADLLADVFRVQADVFTNRLGAKVLCPVALVHPTR